MSNHQVTSDPCNFCVPVAALTNFALDKRQRLIEAHPSAHDKVVVKGSSIFVLQIGAKWFFLDTDVNVSTATDLDTGAVSNGKDYYVYACDNAGSLKFLISLNSTYPQGYNASNSRKLGGFHTLCVNAGTISGHALSGYLANEILPASIWDLKHRPVCEPKGMVYDAALHKWVDIYMPSGTGANMVSVYNGYITVNKDWNTFVDYGHLVQKRLSWDHEFQHFALGSNEETIVYEEEYPEYTGGHIDTNERRMISNIGCEDCCGAIYQWQLDQSYSYQGGTHTHTGGSHSHTENTAASYTQNAQTAAANVGTLTSVDPKPPWTWKDLAAGRGGIYHQGDMGDVKAIAGGSDDYEAAGSQGRRMTEERWWKSVGCTARFVAEPL